MNAIERRLAALERKSAVATCPTSAPFWSEPHGCMMENHGGFVLPCAVSDEEWERSAISHMQKLTGQRARRA